MTHRGNVARETQRAATAMMIAESPGLTPGFRRVIGGEVSGRPPGGRDRPAPPAGAGPAVDVGSAIDGHRQRGCPAARIASIAALLLGRHPAGVPPSRPGHHPPATIGCRARWKSRSIGWPSTVISTFEA